MHNNDFYFSLQYFQNLIFKSSFIVCLCFVVFIAVVEELKAQKSKIATSVAQEPVKTEAPSAVKEKVYMLLQISKIKCTKKIKALSGDKSVS